MKELSIEEKAKAYDEALRVLHKYDGAHIMFTQDLKEEMFPELREVPEDERIRKELIRVFSNRGKYVINQSFGDINVSDILAWLEKQGEQKPNLIIPKFRVGDEIKTSNEESLTITKIDEKGYWSEDLFICGFEEECIWDLVDQKPAEWSEEDKYKISHLTSYLKRLGNDVYVEWLESLKNRVLPQPQKEWSEEDKYNYDIIQYILNNEYVGKTDKENAIKWFKLLKDRYTWKPSERQISALEWQLKNTYKGSWQYIETEKLLEQLKRIMEE